MAKRKRRKHGYSEHEALDRTWVFLDGFEGMVLEHRVVKRNAKAKRLAEAAHQAMFDLYQHLGRNLGE